MFNLLEQSYYDLENNRSKVVYFLQVLYFVTITIFQFECSGDHDMCVPFTGTQEWTRSLGYKIVDEWRSWHSKGQVAG